jgi:hypothetical protein
MFKTIKYFSILFITIGIISCHSSGNRADKITHQYSIKTQQNIIDQDKFIEIAKNNLEQDKIDLTNRSFLYDTNNTHWVKAVNKMNTIYKNSTTNLKDISNNISLNYYNTINDSLKGINYQTIICHYNELRIGGTIWVFIDRKSDKVIRKLHEK